MITKKFDRELYNQNDSLAKNAVLSYLYVNNVDAYINQNKFGIDIVTGSYEVERRPSWSGNKFPFNTIHIPLRKDKFFESACIKYCVVNKECTFMLVINSDEIIKSNIVEVPNKYVASNEYFYNVPTVKFQLISLQENK